MNCVMSACHATTKHEQTRHHKGIGYRYIYIYLYNVTSLPATSWGLVLADRNELGMGKTCQPLKSM